MSGKCLCHSFLDSLSSEFFHEKKRGGRKRMGFVFFFFTWEALPEANFRDNLSKP